MTMVTVCIYILQCADGSYYVGKYQGDDLGNRVAEHNDAKYKNAYTAKRWPVKLVWSDWFPRYDDAVLFERRLKGWSRLKKEALIRGDETALRKYSRRGFRPSSILRDGVAPCGETPPQDEDGDCRNGGEPSNDQRLHSEKPSPKGEGVSKTAPSALTK